MDDLDAMIRDQLLRNFNRVLWRQVLHPLHWPPWLCYPGEEPLIHDQLQTERWYKPPTIFRTEPAQVI